MVFFMLLFNPCTIKKECPYFLQGGGRTPIVACRYDNICISWLSKLAFFQTKKILLRFLPLFCVQPYHTVCQSDMRFAERMCNVRRS